ncbi:IS1 family transposase [Escherichia coli]|uniref:IS1 family transposase n=1 Tax=Escherichia coli TaxID=562 RepID=UPI0022E98D44|nr:IS1 family transposase [Escherichia coli]
MASVSISCPSCSATDGVVRNGKSTAGHQRYLCSHCRKTWQLQFTYTASQPGTHQKIIDMAMNGLKKLRPQSVTSRIQPGSDVIVCAEMDEQWGYVGAKSRQRWLFYAYDSLRKTVVAHVFGERTMATLGRLMSLLSPFDVVIWMTDGWPLYESRLKGKLHVISKRYTQRIERHNLNLRQHLARLGRKSLSFSKSVELHDKVIGHYLNIKHYQ